ncbi:MAG: HD-GYP domain-containing protein, partial [Halarsenatibacteraceae bacterium]
PKEVLLKPGVLNEKEWELMQRHVERGHRIATALEEAGDLNEAILYHHEWWDGSGYPDGLSGEKIPYLARIFSIADAYDVMLHFRSYYGKSKTHQDAIAELKNGAGSQFDPEIIKVFLKILKEKN